MFSVYEYVKSFSHNKIYIFINNTNRMMFRQMRTSEYSMLFIVILLHIFFLPFSLIIIIGRSLNLSDMIPFHFLFSLQANRRIPIQYSARVVNSVAVTVNAFTSVSCAMVNPTVQIDRMKIQRNAKYKVSNSAQWDDLMTGYHIFPFSICEYKNRIFNGIKQVSSEISHREIVIIHHYGRRYNFIWQCIRCVRTIDYHIKRAYINGMLSADRHQYQTRACSCKRYRVGGGSADDGADTLHLSLLVTFALQKLIRYTIMAGRNEINRPTIGK